MSFDYTFNEENTLKNVGIGTNNKVIVMNISNSNNLSLHSSTNNNNPDILSIKNILNKDINKDLNLSAYDGTSINPIIKINNTHQHVNITSNLNVASNLNISENINVKNINVTNNLNVFSNLNVIQDTKLSGNLNIPKNSDNSFINFNFDSENPGGKGKYIDLLRFKPSQFQDNNTSNLVSNTSYLSLSGFEHSFEVLFNDDSNDWTNYTAFSLNFDGRVGIGTKYSSDKKLLVDGNAQMNGNLLVDGNTQMNGNLNITNNLNLTGNLNINNNKLYISDSSAEFSSIGLNMDRGDGKVTHADDCMVEFRCHHSKLNAFVGQTNYSTSRLRLVSGGYYTSGAGHNTTEYHDCVIEMGRAGPVDGNTGDTKFDFGYFFINHDKDFHMTGYNHSISLWVQEKVYAKGSPLESDDRLKFNETLLTNVTETLLKLRPQLYDKANVLINPTSYQKEAGLIVQEIYYEIPELRYLITIPDDAVLIDDNKYRNFTDIQNDPDYSNWGSSSAYLNYNSFITYLIAGFQEHNTQIVNLENENSILKSENELLKTQVNELTNIINNLKTANSFEEFKQTLS